MKKTIFSKAGPIMTSTALLAIVLAGCSGMRSWYSQESVSHPANGSPLVQNCGIVSIGSPTKYVCGGKVYTSFQLNKLRQQTEQKQTAAR